MEEYDDSTTLAHKSVFRFNRPNEKSSSMEKQVPSSIHGWLTHLRNRVNSDSNGSWISDMDFVNVRDDNKQILTSPLILFSSS